MVDFRATMQSFIFKVNQMSLMCKVWIENIPATDMSAKVLYALRTLLARLVEADTDILGSMDAEGSDAQKKHMGRLTMALDKIKEDFPKPFVVKVSPKQMLSCFQGSLFYNIRCECFPKQIFSRFHDGLS